MASTALIRVRQLRDSSSFSKEIAPEPNLLLSVLGHICSNAVELTLGICFANCQVVGGDSSARLQEAVSNLACYRHWVSP